VAEVPEDDRMLTPAEAIAELKVGERALRRLEAQGKIRAVRTLGGHRRYQEKSVRAVLRERENPPETLTVAEVAVLFAVAPTAVCAWVRKGKLTALSRRPYLFLASYIAALLQGEKKGARS
jgi:predicted site-specific integrase-resolvase